MTETSSDKIGDWCRDRVLGTGGFGIVTLWRNAISNELIAVKQIRAGNETLMTAKHRQRWTLEVDIMKRLNHPNVVSAITLPAELDPVRDGLPLLGMEYCSGGDFRKLLNRPENCCGLSEIEVRQLLSHTASAVEYLHSMRIIHRDLKPENIVLQEQDGKTSYKLIDLGYAKELDQGSLCTSFVGTLQYLAPELFMSQKYTGTVDYWSLGLVAHEAITGLRPFLPNQTPAQWIPQVMKKSADQICAYAAGDGTTVFSSSLFPEKHINSILKVHLERWLRHMLSWDSHTRGCKIDNGEKEVIAFTVLNDILAKKIVRVFCVHLCKLFYYEIDESTSMDQFIQSVATDIEIPSSQLQFLLPRGFPPDPRKPATQCWAEPVDEEWTLYVYNKSGRDIPTIKPWIPAKVERMFRESKQNFPYDEQRKMWSHSVFFLRRDKAIYHHLLTAHKVIMTYLLTKNSSMYKAMSKLTTEFSKLVAKLQLFEQSMHWDTQRYEAQARNGGVTSERMFRTWKKNSEIKENVAKVRQQVAELEEKSAVINTRAVELQRSPYARSKQPDILDEIYEKALAAFDSLRKKPKEQKQIPCENTEMIRILVNYLKHRERLLRDLYLHLQRIYQCSDDVLQVSRPLEVTVSEILTLNQQLETFQMQRQMDIWEIIENLCKKIRAIKMGTSSLALSASQHSLNDALSTSPAHSSSSFTNSHWLQSPTLPVPTGSYMAGNQPSTDPYGGHLPSVINKSLEDASSLCHENAIIRHHVQDIVISIGQLQEEIVNQSSQMRWDFLEDPPPSKRNSAVDPGDNRT